MIVLLIILICHDFNSNENYFKRVILLKKQMLNNAIYLQDFIKIFLLNKEQNTKELLI